MGRCIYENGNFVWKYVFGEQPSEQHRIHTQYGIGEYEEEQEEGLDYLSLFMDDIPDLEEILEAGDYENKKRQYDLLSKEYEGLNVHFEDKETKQMLTLIPFEEGKTTDELIKEYEAKGFEFKHWSTATNSPYHYQSKAFAESSDYHFLDMVATFIKYMKEKFNKDNEVDFFTFEGEY